jgi:beta-lactamase superfamily II metal-dependent hydrolase
MRKARLRHFKMYLFPVLIFLLSSANQTFAQPLKIHTIQVHGDAHIIQTPGGKTMLIDAGSSWHAGIVKSFIDSLGIDSIDIAYLSHFHGDHFGGFTGEDGILATYHTKEFYAVDEEHAKSYFNHLILPYSKNENIEFKVMKMGDMIDLDPDIEVRILYPPVPSPNAGNNNGSAACMITDLRNGRKFLYMGDGLEQQARDLAALYQDDLRCDVLKYAHHLQYEADDQFSLGTFMELTQPHFGIITKHKMSKPGPKYHDLTILSLEKLYDFTWNNQSGLKSLYLAKHGHITATCTEDGIITMSASKNNLFIPPKIYASEEPGIKKGPLTLTLSLSEPTWDHYIEEIRGCYSMDNGVTWNEFFYPETQLRINKTTTVFMQARDIYGNCSDTKSLEIVIPSPEEN